jgi:hypothetical protein
VEHVPLEANLAPVDAAAESSSLPTPAPVDTKPPKPEAESFIERYAHLLADEDAPDTDSPQDELKQLASEPPAAADVPQESNPQQASADADDDDRISLSHRVRPPSKHPYEQLQARLREGEG